MHFYERFVAPNHNKMSHVTFSANKPTPNQSNHDVTLLLIFHASPFKRGNYKFSILPS